MNKSPSPILYTFRRCPFAIRARMAIYESKVKVEIREVLLRKKPKAMIKLSPKGTVPVLFINQNKILDESIDIMKWALKLNDPNNILKNIDIKEINSDLLITNIDTKFKYHLDRYKYSNRYSDKGKPINPIEHRNKCQEILIDIDKLLNSNNGHYIYGGNISFIDIAIFPLIRQFRIADKEWFDNMMDLINVKLWLHNMLEENLFKEVMYKYKPWLAGNKPVYFENN